MEKTALFIFQDKQSFRPDTFIALRYWFSGLNPAALLTNLQLSFLGRTYHIGPTAGFICCAILAEPADIGHNVFGATLEISEETPKEVLAKLKAGWLPASVPKPTLSIVFQCDRRAA